MIKLDLQGVVISKNSAFSFFSIPEKAESLPSKKERVNMSKYELTHDHSQGGFPELYFLFELKKMSDPPKISKISYFIAF